MTFAAFAAPALGQADTRPNIVFIIADDLAWDDLGCTGNPGVRTPNLDRLAKGGMRFTNAYLTISSCSPSRASIITGTYPHQTDAEALMHRARALRQEGKFEEAKQAESRARTAVFRSELNTITAQGAEQKRQNALIAGLGVAPEGLAEDQKREVLAQFQNLESGLPSVALAGRSNQKLEKEADRAYATPPKRWEDPSWIPADERKRRRSGVPHKSLTPS